MAKAKQTKEAPAGNTTATETITEKAERNANDVFKRVFAGGKAVAPTGKVPPQAMVIINTLEAAGKDGLSRTELNKNLTGVLVTKQPVGRIVTYYQKLLVECGAVTRTAGAAPAAAA